MKRNNLRFFVLFILVSSMFFGISAISVNASTSRLRTSVLVQATDNSTMIAVAGVGDFTAWGPTTWEFGPGSTWMVRGQGGGPKGMTLEPLFQIRDTDVFPYFEYVPVLATGYSEVESWPSEQNSFGWNNTGGTRVMNITLRENVKFQDGSEWNATVAKWNIDRTYVLIGNLTGTEGSDHNDIMSHMCFKPGIDYEPFFTTSWNYSSTYSNNITTGLPQPPQYYGKNNDPNLSWTNVSRTYVADGRYSIINKTLIVKSADETASGTGGTIQIEWNENLNHIRLIAWMQMISMEQYSDMFYTQIKDTFDWTGDQLACGTGPYKAVEVDKTAQVMRMERFDGYWNFTALRAAGKMVVKTGLISYITADYDGQLTTTAMTAGEADFAYDGPPYGTLFDDQLRNSPILNYTDNGVADSILQVDFIMPNTDLAFRKAASYAFNYSQYLDNVLEGQAIRCDNLMGENSVYINSSIVGSYQDLTIARNALLNDPAYNYTLAAAGIDGSSTTQDWNDFADDVSTLTNATSKELFTFNLLHDLFNVDLTSTLETSLADVGIVLNKSGATPANPYGVWKTLGDYGMWIPMLYDRQTQYDNDMEGFYVDWPMPKTDLAYLDAFYTYKNLYVAGAWVTVPDNWNWGLINDTVLQESIRALYFQNETEQLKTYSRIQERVGTEIYTTMFISQLLQGYVVNKKYDIDWYWGGFDFGYVMIGDGYEAAGVPVEIIPGFPLVALIGVAGISILTIGMKKRKKLK